MNVWGKGGEWNLSGSCSTDVKRFPWNQELCAGLLLGKAFFSSLTYECFYNFLFFIFRNVFFVRTIYRAIFIHRMMKKSMKWTLMKWLKTVGKTTWFPWAKSVKNKHSLWAWYFQSCFKTTVMTHKCFNLVSSRMNPVHKNKCVFSCSRRVIYEWISF